MRMRWAGVAAVGVALGLATGCAMDGELGAAPAATTEARTPSGSVLYEDALELEAAWAECPECEEVLPGFGAMIREVLEALEEALADREASEATLALLAEFQQLAEEARCLLAAAAEEGSEDGGEPPADGSTAEGAEGAEGADTNPLYEPNETEGTNPLYGCSEPAESESEDPDGEDPPPPVWPLGVASGIGFVAAAIAAVLVFLSMEQANLADPATWGEFTGSGLDDNPIYDDSTTEGDNPLYGDDDSGSGDDGNP